MKRAFTLAIKSLFSNPVRTGLTTLGIIIGVGTVILVLSAGAGFRSLINNQVEAFGSNTVIIETKVPPSAKSRNNSAASADLSRVTSAIAITTLTMRDVQDIKRLPNMVNAYGALFSQKPVSYKNVIKNATVAGASSEKFDIDTVKLASGRFYTLQEDLAAAQVAILGNKLANDLFSLEDPIGKIVRVGDLNFEVIGVYAPTGSLSPTASDDGIYVPLNTVQKKISGVNYLVFAVGQMKDNSISEATAEDINLLLRRNHKISDPTKDDFSVQTMTQSLESFNTIFNGITFLLVAIAAISLLVGGVGIMNIMYVIVTERTSEIGLKKALGAHQKDILLEFLVEAILITVLGGLAGIIAGGFLGWVVSLIAKVSGLYWTFSVPLYAIVLGFGVSAVIGLTFGVLPARAASKLDPIEALRYE